MCGRETGMRPRRHDGRDKDIWKGFWKDQVKSLEHKHPVFGTCRQLDHSAISELVVVMVFWIGPSLLGLVLALLFRSSGRIQAGPRRPDGGLLLRFGRDNSRVRVLLRRSIFRRKVGLAECMRCDDGPLH